MGLLRAAQSTRCITPVCKHYGVPNQPKTPLRAFRIPDEIYDLLKAKAADEGRTVTDVVREALREYIQHHNLG